MMKPTKYIEIATGEEVRISTVFKWGGYDTVSLIEYSSGRVYGMPDKEISKYFELVRPCEIEVIGFGGVHDRPLPEQAALEL